MRTPQGPLVAVAAGVLILLPVTNACVPETRAAGNTSDYRVVNSWPSMPPGYRFDQVAGLAVNSRNEIIVFHRADRSWLSDDALIPRPTILRIDAASGEVIDSLGANLFLNPHGLAVDHEDNIWVTDTRLHQVMKLSPEGEVLLVLGEAGVPGNDATHFNGVTDVAVAMDGSVYVTDGYGNNRVVKFSASGEFLLEWGGEGGEPGQFRLPHGLSLDDQGRVYVADRSNSRIQVFDADGTFLQQWKSAALGRPWGLEVAGDGAIYVVDGGDYWSSRQYRSERPDTLPLDRARVHRIDLDGTILDTWGSFGPYAGQFIWPHDITVDRDGGVYVGEVRFGMRVQKFARGG